MRTEATVEVKEEEKTQLLLRKIKGFVLTHTADFTEIPMINVCFF